MLTDDDLRLLLDRGANSIAKDAASSLTGEAARPSPAEIRAAIRFLKVKTHISNSNAKHNAEGNAANSTRSPSSDDEAMSNIATIAAAATAAGLRLLPPPSAKGERERSGNDGKGTGTSHQAKQATHQQMASQACNNYDRLQQNMLMNAPQNGHAKNQLAMQNRQYAQTSMDLFSAPPMGSHHGMGGNAAVNNPAMASMAMMGTNSASVGYMFKNSAGMNNAAARMPATDPRAQQAYQYNRPVQGTDAIAGNSKMHSGASQRQGAAAFSSEANRYLTNDSTGAYNEERKAESKKRSKYLLMRQFVSLAPLSLVSLAH